MPLFAESVLKRHRRCYQMDNNMHTTLLPLVTLAQKAMCCLQPNLESWTSCQKHQPIVCENAYTCLHVSRETYQLVLMPSFKLHIYST
jgi:hypothetical protein